MPPCTPCTPGEARADETGQSISREDELKDESEISRQARWQRKHRAMGLCVLCSEKAYKGWRCEKHYEQHKLTMRLRYKPKVRGRYKVGGVKFSEDAARKKLEAAKKRTASKRAAAKKKAGKKTIAKKVVARKKTVAKKAVAKKTVAKKAVTKKKAAAKKKAPPKKKAVARKKAATKKKAAPKKTARKKAAPSRKKTTAKKRR